jgi:menaquinone-dependent protoporphyrinogen oxidase
VKVLVSAASRHGSTDEVARAIAEILRESGHSAVVAAPETLTLLNGFDAAVVGSAVYYGKWLDTATTFVDRHLEWFDGRPVWLFSVGPLGDPPKPEAEPAEIPALVAKTRAREHRLFTGRLDMSRLSLGEKIIVKGVRAAEGDFRQWDEIRAWARAIAEALTPVGVAG